MRKLVLWGHHLDEYREMFAVSTAQDARWLEFGCGASAVNAECHKNPSASPKVISCDPLFDLDKATFVKRAHDLFEKMVSRIRRDEGKFDFTQYGGIDDFITYRREGMDIFFADYEQGQAEKRYLPLVDNVLPFSDFHFDFALSAHFLFADLDDQDVDFHLLAIRELARVAKEVRLFPLIDRYGQTSPFLGPVLLGLQQEGYGVEVRNVDYKLQPTGNAMLRVWAQQCHLI